MRDEVGERVDWKCCNSQTDKETGRRLVCHAHNYADQEKCCACGHKPCTWCSVSDEPGFLGVVPEGSLGAVASSSHEVEVPSGSNQAGASSSGA